MRELLLLRKLAWQAGHDFLTTTTIDTVARGIKARPRGLVAEAKSAPMADGAKDSLAGATIGRVGPAFRPPKPKVITPRYAQNAKLWYNSLALAHGPSLDEQCQEDIAAKENTLTALPVAEESMLEAPTSHPAPTTILDEQSPPQPAPVADPLTQPPPVASAPSAPAEQPIQSSRWMAAWLFFLSILTAWGGPATSPSAERSPAIAPAPSTVEASSSQTRWRPTGKTIIALLTMALLTWLTGLGPTAAQQLEHSGASLSPVQGHWGTLLLCCWWGGMVLSCAALVSRAAPRLPPPLPHRQPRRWNWGTGPRPGSRVIVITVCVLIWILTLAGRTAAEPTCSPGNISNFCQKVEEPIPDIGPVQRLMATGPLAALALLTCRARRVQAEHPPLNPTQVAAVKQQPWLENWMQSWSSGTAANHPLAATLNMTPMPSSQAAGSKDKGFWTIPMSTLLLPLVLSVASILTPVLPTPTQLCYIGLAGLALTGVVTGLLWACACRNHTRLIASLLPLSSRYRKRTRRWRASERRMHALIDLYSANQWRRKCSSCAPWNHQPRRSIAADQHVLAEVERRAARHYRAMVQARAAMDAAEAADCQAGIDGWVADIDHRIPGWRRFSGIVAPPGNTAAAWQSLVGQVSTVTVVQTLPDLTQWLQLTIPSLWLGLLQLLKLWWRHRLYSTWQGGSALSTAGYYWLTHWPAKGLGWYLPHWPTVLRPAQLLMVRGPLAMIARLLSPRAQRGKTEYPPSSPTQVATAKQQPWLESRIRSWDHTERSLLAQRDRCQPTQPTMASFRNTARRRRQACNRLAGNAISHYHSLLSGPGRPPLGVEIVYMQQRAARFAAHWGPFLSNCRRSVLEVPPPKAPDSQINACLTPARVVLAVGPHRPRTPRASRRVSQTGAHVITGGSQGTAVNHPTAVTLNTIPLPSSRAAGRNDQGLRATPMSTLLLLLVLSAASILTLVPPTPTQFCYIGLMGPVLMGVLTGMLWASGHRDHTRLIVSLLPLSRRYNQRTRRWRASECRMQARIDLHWTDQWLRHRSSRTPWNHKPRRANTEGQCALAEEERRAARHYRAMVQARVTMDAAEAADCRAGIDGWVADIDHRIPGWRRHSGIATPPVNIAVAWQILVGHVSTVVSVQTLPDLTKWLQLTMPLLWRGLLQLLQLWARHRLYYTWQGGSALLIAGYYWLTHRPSTGRGRHLPRWSTILRLALHHLAYSASSGLLFTGGVMFISALMEARLLWGSLHELQRVTNIALGGQIWVEHASTMAQLGSLLGLPGWLQQKGPLLWLGSQQLLALWSLHPVYHTWQGGKALVSAGHGWLTYSSPAGCQPHPAGRLKIFRRWKQTHHHCSARHRFTCSMGQWLWTAYRWLINIRRWARAHSNRLARHRSIQGVGQWLWRARCKGHPGTSAMGLWWGSILSLTHCLVSRTDSLAVNIALPVLLGLTCDTTWRNGVPLGTAQHVKQSFLFVLNTAGDLLQHVKLHAAVYCTPVWATMLPGSPNWLIALAAITLLALDLGTQKSTSTATPEGGVTTPAAQDPTPDQEQHLATALHPISIWIWCQQGNSSGPGLTRLDILATALPAEFMCVSTQLMLDLLRMACHTVQTMAIACAQQPRVQQALNRGKLLASEDYHALQSVVLNKTQKIATAAVAGLRFALTSYAVTMLGPSSHTVGAVWEVSFQWCRQRGRSTSQWLWSWIWRIAATENPWAWVVTLVAPPASNE